jgi:hypothetical protein
MVTLADEPTAARTEDAYAIEEDQTMRRVAAAGTFRIDDD